VVVAVEEDATFFFDLNPSNPLRPELVFVFV
jgi:hypothetical protein